MVAMTLVTGLVDAFSYLVLGHVFVANMTGNVVLLGFALVGAPGFSITASLVAIGSFGLGAVGGGRLASRFGGHRGRHLSSAAAVQGVFLAAAMILAISTPSPVPSGDRYGLIVALAMAMGIQNATARHLAVPDLHDHRAHDDDHRDIGRQRHRRRQRLQIGSAEHRHCRHAGGRRSRGRVRRPPPHRLSPGNCSGADCDRGDDDLGGGAVKPRLGAG